MKFKKILLTCMIMVLSVGSLVQLMAVNEYVTSLEDTSGKIVINNAEGYYVGYSLDYTRNNETGTPQTLETSQEVIQTMTDLSSEQLSQLRFMLASSPSAHWYQIQEGWPNVVTNQGVEDPKTWQGDQLLKADVYVQYIIWNYVAKAHQDVARFASLRPEAYTFVQNNPELVNFYESSELIHGEQLDSIQVMIQNQNQNELVAGNVIGPFIVDANLSATQKTSEIFNLEKVVVGDALQTNLNYFQFVDEDGLPITKVKVDQPFYVKLSSGIYSGEISFTATTTQTTYAVTMEDVLFHSEQDGAILAIPMSAQGNLRYGEELQSLTVNGRIVDGNYSSSFDQSNSRILVDNGTGSYAGYSVDFTKGNTTLTQQTKTTNQTTIVNKLGLTESKLSHMRYLLAYSPAVNWSYVQSNWPTIHTPNGDLIPSSWSENDYSMADQYFQYIVWGYVASTTNTMNQLEALQPDAYAFLQSNPDLVSLYSSGTMAYGDALNMYEFTVNDLSNSEAKALNDIGPFTITSNLSTEQKEGTTYTLSTLYYESFPWLNASLSYFVDGQGLPIHKVKDGQAFYIRLLEGVTDGQLTFEVEGQTMMVPTSMNSVLFSANGEAAILAVPAGANRNQTKQSIQYELPVLGRAPGRYQWIWNDFKEVKDMEGSKSYFTVCVEKNVYLVEGVGFDHVITDPVEIAKEMELSLESLYKLRYVYSKTPLFTPIETLRQDYPAYYKELNNMDGPVLGVGGTYYFNDYNYQHDAKFINKVYNIAQNMIWYTMMVESNSPRYRMPAETVASLERNPDVIKYFYDPNDSSKSIESLENENAPTVNIVDQKEIITEGQTKLIGPYKVESTIQETFDLSIGDPSLNANITLVNAQKEEISQINTGESFYLLVEDNHLVNAVDVRVTSSSEHFTRYQEYYFESRYIQNLYTIEPVNEKISQSIHVEWQNEQPVGALLIEKVDANNHNTKLSATFELRNNLDEVVATLQTNTQGVGQLDAIPVGDYELVEVQAPVGYQISTQHYPVSISEGIVNTLYTGDNALKNNRSRGYVTIDVVDDDNESKVCEGIVEIVDENDNIIEQVTLNNDCEKSTIELPTKNYKARMKETSEAYDIDLEEYPFSIEEGDTVHLRMRVRRATSLVHVELMDEETKENICEARIHIYDENGEIVSKEIGDSTCYAEFPDVPVGSYFVEVTDLPTNYEAKEIYPIKVEKGQETHVHLEFKSTLAEQADPELPETGLFSVTALAGLSMLGLGVVVLLKKNELD